MEKIIRNILKMDQDIRKFYGLYYIVFITILVFFLVMLEENFEIVILMGFWVAVSFFLLVLPCMRDFSRAISGKYYRVEGVAEEKYKDILTWRVLDIYTSEGRKICNINVWHKEQISNSYVVIEYLPHTKFGRVKKYREKDRD